MHKASFKKLRIKYILGNEVINMRLQEHVHDLWNTWLHDSWCVCVHVLWNMTLNNNILQLIIGVKSTIDL